MGTGYACSGQRYETPSPSRSHQFNSSDNGRPNSPSLPSQVDNPKVKQRPPPIIIGHYWVALALTAS